VAEPTVQLTREHAIVIRWLLEDPDRHFIDPAAARRTALKQLEQVLYGVPPDG